ncbi:hypothetical protein AB0F77_31140 [Streptomyces sp. NPDC026672]|uniref:hypothetical protein n=1 Tax=unclassified Streptomyces TaxID=2593676 RepID=UPI0033F77F56
MLNARAGLKAVLDLQRSPGRSATGTDRVAVREQYMNRAIPEFVGIPAPAVTCWTTAHADLHRANLTASLLLDREGWGRGPQGFDCAALYAYTLLQPNVAARVRAAFPLLGSPDRQTGALLDVRHPGVHAPLVAALLHQLPVPGWPDRPTCRSSASVAVEARCAWTVP